MSKFAALGGGTTLVAGSAAAVVGAVALGAYVSGVFSPPQTPAQSAPTQVVQTAPEAARKQEIPTESPAFDLVRVDAQGEAMIAGSAPAGSTVSIRVDDNEIAQVKADAGGQFASLVSLPENASPSVLTLDAGEGRESTQQVIVAPVVAQEPAAPAKVEATVAEAPDAPLKDVQSAASEPKPEPVAPTQEPAAPTVLLATQEGVRVLQAPDAPKPEAMTALLGSISYDAAGAVALTGQGAGRFVRVYLDNAPVMTSQIAANGNWQAELPSVDTGIYTLRVDELDDAGKVVSRVETPFKREDSAVLAAAVKPDVPVQAITVQPGATLWAIARERYGNGTLYTRVVQANRDSIRNPDLIYPGQVFNIPD